jgi:glyoxylase-like metal-dependent hydrolase (beta-lactamase superfamily II)
MEQFRLPDSVRVIVRDWLNANNVVLLQPGHNVVVDTGYVSHAHQTLALLRRPEHLGEQPLHLVVNTHCHSDHMGGNALLARTHACPIAVPAGEAPLIRSWDTRALWLDYADQRGERFVVDQELVAGGDYEWGGLSWRAIAAPGHDMSALVFYCSQERLLISGDALWENGFGIVLPEQADGLPAARDTLDAIAALDVRIVIPGHGNPFSGVEEALSRSYRRVEAFEADPVRMARHVLKVMLVFTLLERNRLPLSKLPALLDEVPVYREYNAAYFNLEPKALSELLVGELERAGAVARSGPFLMPVIRDS